MTKHLVLCAAILSASLPVSASLAQPAPGRGEPKPGFSTADYAAFLNSRIAALKAGLELTPAQEKLWPALETTIREIAKSRQDLREKTKEAREHGDLIAKMRVGAKAIAARGAELEKFADAAKPLYDSLDEAQKHRFGVLIHVFNQPIRPHHFGSVGPGHRGPGGPGPGPRPEQAPDDDDD
jgi:hypothetical protein